MRAGRTSAARAYDTMIAAIAIANGLPVFTCNPDDFLGIEGLSVIAIPHPDAHTATDRQTTERI
jgi:tRNA(fMet)-specific endonuclease VapC